MRKKIVGVIIALLIVAEWPLDSRAQQRSFPFDPWRFISARYHPQRVLIKRRGMRRPQILTLRKGEDVLTRLSLLSYEDDVEYAEPDLLYTAERVIPNDPSFTNLWGLEMIGAPEAWGVTRGSSNVVVAVIDTGVDYLHPDLRDNIWVNTGEIPGNLRDDDGNGYVDDVYGYNALSPSQPPADDNRHGTHVAGTIGAVGDNQVGVVGVNWRVKIMALKFLDRDGSGYLSDALETIDYILTMRRRGVNIRVVNASWGADTYSRALEEAIERLRAEGILFVAAAGNGSTNVKQYPAAYEGVLSVAAMDQNDDLAFFSNYGDWVDLAAPGRSILSTVPGGRYASFSGTSMAAPHVAGLAALALSVRDVRLNELENALRQGVRSVPALAGKVSTGGVLDAPGTLRALNADDPAKVCERDCPPRVSLSASRLVVDDGEGVSFTANGSDPDGDPLTYRWRTTAGRLRAGITEATLETAGINPTPGAPPIVVVVTVTVEDGRGHSASASRSITVRPPNRPPQVALEASRTTIQDGFIVFLTARGSDPDGDALTYTWTSSKGTITGSGASAQLDTIGINPIPDADPVRVTVRVRASDGRGGDATAQIEITVTAPPKVAISATPTSVRLQNRQATFFLSVRKHSSYRGDVTLQVIPMDALPPFTVAISPYRFFTLTHQVTITLGTLPAGPQTYRVLVRARTNDGKTYDSNVVTLMKR
ncbi:MAG: S8 family serine peptidase [Blastocatellia bacterium]|nr:S8 family serine peptidase [Blastocatellia bacterium]MCS7157329.1 S8 family serine peptidase [Blastocatellia bacterium]MCX7753195.1 S8 family serine peptidase [Blastocatellia bacterium]MDW8168233.1 S8 family serine peptidase [Acidobacteriota bacterium]MDW8255473.1 S8 family serine peptidase [Acidobacteriota bacterium]